MNISIPITDKTFTIKAPKIKVTRMKNGYKVSVFKITNHNDPAIPIFLKNPGCNTGIPS